MSLLRIRGALHEGRVSGSRIDNFYLRSTANVNLGAIIGGVASGVILLVLGAVLFRFLKRRRDARLGEKLPPDLGSDYQETPAPAPRNFIGHPKYNILNPGANYGQTDFPDQPVEAGLMSRCRDSTFPSDVSRRTPA
jgi:hypothetical protein